MKQNLITKQTKLDSNHTPKLTIIFLNFNRIEDTIKTTNQLKKLCCSRKNIEIIAVDNASKDGTDKFLVSQSDWINILQLKDNLGIEGLNLGFEMAKGDYILVLDDDSHPSNIETIDLVIQILDINKDAAAVACNIELEDGTPFKTWHLPIDSNIIYSDADKKNTTYESPAFVGCGFAIKRDIFKKIGWFPAKYFLYQNEIYVTIKIKELGYKIYYEPKCTVVHRNSPVGRAGWRQVFYPTRNTIWLLRAYAPFPMALYYIFSRLCFGFIRAFESKEYNWYLKAVKEALGTAIERTPLSPELNKKFSFFWQQNSIFHHIKWSFKKSIH